MQACEVIEERPRKKSGRRDEAAYVVYWIAYKHDESMPLYVGVTKNLQKRWREHRAGSEQLDGIENRESITIRVVDTVVGTFREAEQVELKHITNAATLNPNLLNRRRNLILEKKAKHERQRKMSRICVFLPIHLAEWARSQPKASRAIATAIQFYMDHLESLNKVDDHAAAKKTI